MTCEECGRSCVTRGRGTRFCSNKCSAVFTGRARRSATGEVICAQCGAKFIGQTANFKNLPARKYCSKRCYGLANRAGGPTFTCAHCGATAPRKFIRASGGYNYRSRFCSKVCAINGQRTGGTDRWGYRVFTVNGRQIREHRAVMERTLGRTLLPYETVHHVNGVRHDNRPENLEVWIGRHTPGQRLADALAWAESLLRDHGYHVSAPPPSA